MRSCNHCPSGKALSIRYCVCVCVCVALVMRHATRMRHIVMCGLPRSAGTFPHYLVNDTIFEKKKTKKKKTTEHKMCSLISSTAFSEIFLIIRRSQWDVTKNVYWSSCKVPVILVRFFMKLKFYRQFLGKYSNIKFHENSSSGSQVVPCGQMDGWQTWSYKSLFVILRTRQKMSLVCWWAAWIPCNSVELLLFHQRRWIDRH